MGKNRNTYKKHSILPEYDTLIALHEHANSVARTSGDLFPSLRRSRLTRFRWRAAFYISRVLKRASLTVEAALVLPVFLGTMVLLLQVLDFYRIQGLMTISLQESAMDLGVMESVLTPMEEESAGSSLPGLTFCMAYASGKLPGEVVRRGSVSLLGSRIEGDKLILEAVWIPNTVITFLSIPLFRVSARAVVHFFNGRGPDDFVGSDSTASEMVYVTEYESVYHTSASCTHIALSIHAISQSSLALARNKSGAHYGCCEKCVGSGLAASTVYVSDYGSKYHNSASCSGLKRTVRLVSKESLGELPICSKCQARG